MNKENSESKNCEYNNFKRARYFHGMLMTERDFSDEQKYHIEKRKLLNRMLHGCGVVCGLQIKPTPTARSTITISPGLALDCNGNEIYVNKEYDLNLEKILNPEPSPKGQQVVCAKTETRDEDKLYIIIRYDDRPTDQVPIYAPGVDCKEKACENSRFREGFCIEVIRDGPCPNSGNPDDPCANLKKPEDIRKLICEDLLNPCPEPCSDPKVVLGSISVNGSVISETGINKDMINNWDCRKYVMSFGLLQHFRTKFAPKKVSLDTIFGYESFGTACENPDKAKEKFDNICKEPERET